MTPEDKKLANKLRKLREAYEAKQQRLLDEHMEAHYPSSSPFWRFVRQNSIEVASWPEEKRRRCYANPQE